MCGGGVWGGGGGGVMEERGRECFRLVCLSLVTDSLCVDVSPDCGVRVHST